MKKDDPLNDLDKTCECKGTIISVFNGTGKTYYYKCEKCGKRSRNFLNNYEDPYDDFMMKL